MKKLPHTPEEWAKVLQARVDKFKSYSPQAQGKLLARLEKAVAEENDPEIAELFGEIKSILLEVNE